MFMADKRKTMEHVNKRWVRVLTVITYIIAISLIALVLGLYYRLVWHPNYDDSDNNNADGTGLSIGPALNQTIYIGHIKVIGMKDILEQVRYQYFFKKSIVNLRKNFYSSS